MLKTEIQKNKATGLTDVVAGDTAICTVGKEGKDLLYRGYSIKDFCANKAPFEEVAYLLIYGELPTQTQLDAYRLKLQGLRDVPEEIKKIVELLPADSHPMDVLRSACSVLGCFEPQSKNNKPSDIADRLLGFFPSALLYWHHFHENKKRIDLKHTKANSVAGHFLELLNQTDPDKNSEVQKLIEENLNMSLILYAEHGFNASAFTARIAAGTKTDFYSAVTAAAGVLKGISHGGANEQAMELIKRFKTPDEAKAGINALLDKSEIIMGFGHRIYKGHDPRSDILKVRSKLLSDTLKPKNQPDIYAISEAMESVMSERKQKYPNADYYSASVYDFCGIPQKFFTTLFLISRTTGYTAHYEEELKNGKLIRPIENYVGPDLQKYIPIAVRKG